MLWLIMLRIICSVVVMICEFFGFLVIRKFLFCFFMMVGDMEFSICLFGFILFVLLLIRLQVLGILGLVLKLFILLLSRKLVFFMVIFELQLKLMVQVLEMVLFYLLMIEKWVVFGFLQLVGLFGVILLVGFVWLLLMFWCRFLVQDLLVRFLRGMFM